MLSTIWELLARGGPVMYPLAAVSVAALAITLERAWFFVRLGREGEDLLDAMRAYLGEGRLLEAMQWVRRFHGPAAAVLAEGLAAWDRPVEELRERMERVGQEEVARMEARLAWLDAIVTGAPMLGLLGTVTGIIRSFRVLSHLQGIDTPSALSAGIAEALITTAAGLVIAIPALFAYVYFSGLVDRRVATLNRITSRFVQLAMELKGRS